MTNSFCVVYLLFNNILSNSVVPKYLKIQGLSSSTLSGRVNSEKEAESTASGSLLFMFILYVSLTFILVRPALKCVIVIN